MNLPNANAALREDTVFVSFVSPALARTTLLSVLRDNPRQRVARLRHGNIVYELLRWGNGYIFRVRKHKNKKR
jgi:hypothetical protein